MSKSNKPHDGPTRERIGDQVTIFRIGKTWYANYQLDKKQCRHTLKTTNKKEARRKALIIESELLQGTLRPPPPAVSIDSAIEEYLTYLEVEGRASTTLTKYRQVLGDVAELARSLRVSQLSQLNLRFVDRYRKKMADKGRAAKTICTHTTILRQLVSFAVSRDMLATDPLARLKNPKPKGTKQPCWSPAEMELILAGADERLAQILTVFADTGMRFGELQWLAWEDVDFDTNQIHIRPKEGWRPKSGEARSTPMTARVRALLAGLEHQHHWVFTAGVSRDYPAADHQIQERRLLRSLKRLLKRLNLPEDGKLHTFRHGFISRALASGVPNATLRTWVGHVSEEMLKRYTHTHDDHSQAAIQLLNGETNNGRSSKKLANPDQGDAA